MSNYWLERLAGVAFGVNERFEKSFCVFYHRPLRSVVAVSFGGPVTHNY